MKIVNKLKDLFKKQNSRKQTITFKTSKLDFIGKSQTIDILNEQDVADKINDNNAIINAEFEQKLTDLKDYSDNQDNAVKQELQQNINDLKQYSDNEDNKVKQYSDGEDAKIKQSVTTVSNKLNQVEQTANNANTVATRADNQSKTNKADITTNKTRLTYLERRTTNSYQWRVSTTVNGNMWTRELIAGNFARYLSNQTPRLTIPTRDLDNAYNVLSSKGEKDNNTQVAVRLIARVNVYIQLGNLFYGFSDMLRGPFDNVQIQLNKTNNDYVINDYHPLSMVSNARLDNSTKTTIYLEFTLRR